MRATGGLSHAGLGDRSPLIRSHEEGNEGAPEAFHWFPQLATPMLCLPVNNPLRPPPPSRHAEHIATTTTLQ